MPQPLTKSQIVSAIMLRMSLYGFAFGAIVGAVAGIVLSPALYALIIGAIMGLILSVPVGIVIGLLDSLITVGWFYPLKDVERYRLIIGVSMFLVPGVCMWILLTFLAVNFGFGFQGAVAIGVAITAGMASQLIAGWYGQLFPAQ